MDKMIKRKLLRLEQVLREYEHVAVAFSAGVDSSLLLTVAKTVLQDDVIAVTARPFSFPVEEVDAAKLFCRQHNIRHVICCQNDAVIDQLRTNPKNRCYICKKSFYSDILRIAKENGCKYVLDGSIVDDDYDYRPSRKALQELDIKTPLHDIGFTKEDVRRMAKSLGLDIWNKQSVACYATRFPYDEYISDHDLAAVSEGERYLASLGFSMVRVRHHNTVARIEVLPEEMRLFLLDDTRDRVLNYFNKLGYLYVSVDLHGYVAGSMNQLVTDAPECSTPDQPV